MLHPRQPARAGVEKLRGAARLESCRPGKECLPNFIRMDNGGCREHICTCEHGTGARGSDCAEDGTENCVSCDSSNYEMRHSSKHEGGKCVRCVTLGGQCDAGYFGHNIDKQMLCCGTYPGTPERHLACSLSWPYCTMVHAREK